MEVEPGFIANILNAIGLGSKLEFGGLQCRGVAPGKYTKEELLKFISSKGGLVALLGTNSVIQVVERIQQGDERARKVLDAMCYNIAKQIGAMAAAMAGQVDGILLTGGIAFNEQIVDAIRERCSFIAPVSVYPGENELEALAINALVVLRGVIQPKIYE